MQVQSRAGGGARPLAEMAAPVIPTTRSSPSSCPATTRAPRGRRRRPQARRRLRRRCRPPRPRSRRAPGGTIVRVVSPEAERDGWHSRLGAARRRGRHAVPRRLDTDGRSTATASASTCSSTRCSTSSATAVKRLASSSPREAAHVEAWTQIEIDRCDDESARRSRPRSRGGIDDVRTGRRGLPDDARPDGRRSAPSIRCCPGWPTASSCSSAPPTTTGTPTARSGCGPGASSAQLRDNPRVDESAAGIAGDGAVVIARTDDTVEGPFRGDRQTVVTVRPGRP